MDHLKEAGFFSGKDLDSIKYQLQSIEESIERGRAEQSPHMILLLETRIENIRTVVVDLEESLSRLSPQLSETHEKLVSILRSLSGLAVRPKVSIPA